MNSNFVTNDGMIWTWCTRHLMKNFMNESGGGIQGTYNRHLGSYYHGPSREIERAMPPIGVRCWFGRLRQ
jgi:hypothetical protein